MVKKTTTRLTLLVLGIAWPALLQAQSAETFPSGKGLVPGVVVMGMDAVGRAWPCGSASVAMGCGMNNPPLVASSTTIAGTVAAAGTYQLVIPASGTRKGCLLVNKSTSPLMVFLGLPGAATPATSIMLAAGTATADGGRMNCAVGSGVVISDAISVASGTAGAAYLVIWQ